MGTLRVIVRVPNWLGDAVLSLAALRDVRSAFPEARLGVLARPSVAGLYGALPEVDEVLEIRGLRADAALLRGRCDAVVLLTNSFGSALAAWLARVPERWGWATDGRSALLTRAAPAPERLRGQNQLYYYRAMLSAVGVALSDPPRPSLACPPEWSARGAGLLGGDGPWIGVAPGAQFGSAKRWPAERFAAAAQRLAAEGGASVAILGSAAERPLAARITSLLQVPSLDLCGRTTLPDLVGTLARMTLLLSNDSGPMHLAGALGTPVVAVFGPTDWTETAPLGAAHRLVREPVPCAPCRLRECPIDHRCMSGVAAARVVDAARALLAAREGAAS